MSTASSSHENTIIMDAAPMTEHLRRMAREIVARNDDDLTQVVLLGILRRGRPLAERLAGIIEEMTGYQPPVGSLATTFYRDDVRTGKATGMGRGQTHFDFPIDDRVVILVDDVLAAGRTIRAALDEVMDYGRPDRIQLACFIDRGGRELPIHADFLGETVPTTDEDWVTVHLEEVDGEDAVLVERRVPEEE
jgi:pyrimidine operon attenuation protein/uracil phosphoribosyltransferase